MYLFRSLHARTPSEVGAVALHYGLLILFFAVVCAATVAVSGGWAVKLFDAIDRALFSGAG